MKKSKIYVTVVTSSLTVLANKVSVIVKDYDTYENVASLLAFEIAKENKLNWSNVLYSVSETLEGENKNYKIIKNGSRLQAMDWWNELSSLRKTQLCDTNTRVVGDIRRYETLTGSQIERLWRAETEKTHN